MLKPDAALRKDRTTAPTLEHRHFAFIAATLKECRPMQGTGAAKLAQYRDTIDTFADARHWRCEACAVP